MNIKRNQPNPIKFEFLIPGETFMVLNGFRIFIKTKPIYSSNINAISIEDGQAFFIDSDTNVVKVDGEFVEK